MRNILSVLILIFGHHSFLSAQPADTTLFNQFIQKGEDLREDGQYGEALKTLRKALDLYEKKAFDYPIRRIDVEREIGGILLDKGDYDKSLAIFEEALDYAKKHFSEWEEPVIRLYLDVGIAHYYMGDFDLALSNYQKAEKAILESNGKNEKLLSNCYNNIGICYYVKRNYKRALVYYKKALDIGIRHLGKNHIQIASTYNNIGICHKLMQDFNQAIVYYDNALAIKLKNLPEGHPQLVPNYNNLGSCYLSLRQYEKALEYYEKGAAIILENFGLEHPQLAALFNNMGNCYAKLGEYPIALKHLEQSLSIRKKIYRGFHPEIGRSYGNIGDCLKGQRKYEEALASYRKALDYFFEKPGEYPASVAQYYTELAIVYQRQKKFGTAFLHFEEALKAMDYRETDFQNLDRHIAPDILMQVLTEYANALTGYYSHNKDAVLLKTAKKLFDEAILVLEYLKTGFREAGSKQILLDNFFSTYEGAIATCHQLFQITDSVHYTHQAFRYAEQSNSILLQESVQKTHAERYAELPDSLLERERDLKADISFYEQKRFNETQKRSRANPQKINEWNRLIFNLKQDYFSLMDDFENNYPKYFELKYAAPTLSVGEIQKDILKEDQALTEYFVGDDHVFVFVITKDTFAMEYIPKIFPLEAWVEEFRNSIVFYNPLREDVAYLNQKYANLAQELYALLFEPIKNIITDQALIIVPGGILGYLPFEALLTDMPERENAFLSHPYLIHKHRISYAYSAWLLKEPDMNTPSDKRGSFLGFAPRFDAPGEAIPADNRKYELGALRYNIPEVRTIHRLMGGMKYLDSLATEACFLETAPRFQILHLATHGKANDLSSDYSFLAFYEIEDSIENEYLYVKDLYNLELQADMIVLSACETGIGELRRGEGIISLARGFFYAGAQSIVTTLWSIDDKPTAGIMEDFYKNLKNGNSKDVSLRQAKLSYIASQTTDTKAHPRFWAGFVPVGEMEALVLEKEIGNGWVLGIGGFLTLALLVWFFKRYPSMRTP